MTNDLERRVVELETRLAFQEQALSELSDALASSRMEAGKTLERLHQALEDMKQSRADGFVDPSQEPPPPHY
jgi:SlyX protein